MPADGLLFKVRDLHVQQAALTGESLPVEKQALDLQLISHDTGDEHKVFLGTSVVSGTSMALISVKPLAMWRAETPALSSIKASPKLSTIWLLRFTALLRRAAKSLTLRHAQSWLQRGETSSGSFNLPEAAKAMWSR